MRQLVVEEDHQWDKKKIAIGIGVFVLLLGTGLFAKSYFLDSTTSVVRRDSSKSEELVEGANTSVFKTSEATPTPYQKSPLSSFSTSSIQEGVQKQLETIKEKVANLNVSDVAQNSPQYKKVVEDLQNLQGLPKEEAKKACLNICETFK